MKNDYPSLSYGKKEAEVPRDETNNKAIGINQY